MQTPPENPNSPTPAGNGASIKPTSVQGIDVTPATKTGAYEKLNQVAINFYKLQEKHAFGSLCFTVIFVGSLAVWSFYQDCQQGGGFMIFIGAIVILFVFGFCFYANWQSVKKEQCRVLFWQAWICACLFPIVLCSSLVVLKQHDAKYEAAIAGTNLFYSSNLVSLTNEINSCKNQLDGAKKTIESQSNVMASLNTRIAFLESDHKMAAKPDWNKLMERDYTDCGALFNDSNDAFEKGDYNYCKLFYERSKKLSPSNSRNLIQIQPLYIMSKYSQNPTDPDGFQKEIEAFVEDLAKNKDDESILSVIIFNLNKVRKRIDESNRSFVSRVVDRVLEIKNKTTVH